MESMDSVREARTGKPKHQGSSAIPYLPSEVTTELLARLPVKSLLKFKTVCKSWLSLISSTEFVKKHDLIHRARSYYSSSTNSKRLLISWESQALMCYSPKSRPREIPIDIHIERFDHSGKNHHQRELSFDIIGSCDGLVCLKVGDCCVERVFLWNPCTRECVEAKERNGEDVRIFSLHHGFGYDYNSDDYKVLKVYHKTTTCISMIYTLRTDSWRRIQDYPRGAFPLEKCATYVNGALHWLAKIRQNDPFIIALDLTSETYMEVAVPDYGTGSSFEGVGALEGCLCVLVDGKETDLWVMKEYGVKESWTKFLTIPTKFPTIPSVLPPVYFYLKTLTNLIWFLGNDEIVLDIYTKMVSYNAKTKSTTDLGIPVCLYDRSHVYVESLVSLSSYNELGGK
uniref:F-box/kelch-repeat protein At3g23880-like n=1 Tax=Fragaria vesca subsp. vesca TaxID=101020 RepID=UPI0005C7FF39|nr:PREDICTED: F-box/kelch-repeat protein At3g23880-like [Fragaria vesca subsp. vesca]